MQHPLYEIKRYDGQDDRYQSLYIALIYYSQYNVWIQMFHWLRQQGTSGRRDRHKPFKVTNEGALYNVC